MTIFERDREGYSVGVDSRLRIPLWVQYELRPDELNGPGDRDNSRFAPDRSLPSLAQAQLSDYRGSGFDRGHMAPAGDMKRSQAVMNESFLLSNMSPQVGVGFNRGIWRLLEEAVRDWVRDRGKLTIVIGPVFSADQDATVTYGVIGESQVAVPNAFFKVVLDQDAPGGPDVLAFLIPNRAIFGQGFDEFLVSVDEIEAATGLDLLDALPDAEEERIEARRPSSTWQAAPRTRGLVQRAAEDVRLSLIEFDAEGDIVQPESLDELVDSQTQPPTHVFLMAHGWNNSREDATSSYQAMLSLMGELADAHPGLRPANYRPLVVGVYWPSKAWDEQSGRIRSLATDEDLTLAICKVLPAERSSGNYLQDVMRMRDLLNQPPEQVTEGDYQDAWTILQKYSLPADIQEDRSAFDEPPPVNLPQRMRGLGGYSIRDLFRVFTFWQMKKRAGTVGGNGGNQLLARLMRAWPTAEIHLGGHSFGCKLWLSALTQGRRQLPRPANSLMMVQAAISSYAFAPNVPGQNRPGGYRPALEAVDGPLVATFSSQDYPLTYAYPIGSRLAGQTGELSRELAEPSRYSALGAVGAAGEGRRLQLQPVPTQYQLQKGLSSIDGSTAIDSHSGFFNEQVAWLLWTAINYRGQP